MSTEYTIELGYISGYSFKDGYDAAWEILVNETHRLINEPALIATEARAYGSPEVCCDRGCLSLLEACKAYVNRGMDAPLAIIEDDHGRRVIQFTTGNRPLREHVRRAFCRLLIQRMHRQQIEVNLVVS